MHKIYLYLNDLHLQNSVQNLCKFTFVCNEFTNVFTKVSYFMITFVA